MNDEERLAMEKEEKDAVFANLVNEIGWVFIHPILREWIKVAPSVNSIDKWISGQFGGYAHKLELIKAMRKAFTAWKKVNGDTHKELLKTPRSWRLSDMFIFDPNRTQFLGEDKNNNLFFALAIKFLSHPEPEKAVSCREWPMLLREFGYQNGNNFKMSADHWGDDTNQIRSVKEIGNRFWEDGRSEAFKNNSKDLNSFGYKLFVNQKRFDGGISVAWADFYLKKFGINTQTIMVDPQSGEIYPRFYKTAYLCDHRYGDMIHSIKVFWPIDCCGDNQKGRVIFSKSIRVSDQMRAVLELEYEFDIQFKLVAIPEHIIYESYGHVKLEIFGQQSSLFQESCPVPKTQKVTEAFGALFEDFVAAWEFGIKDRGKISLERILGKSILEFPPDSLIQIFTGSKIADDLSGKYRK